MGCLIGILYRGVGERGKRSRNEAREVGLRSAIGSLFAGTSTL